MENSNSPAWWLLIIVGGIALLTLQLGNEYGISSRFTIPIVIVTLLAFGTMWLWMHANANATGGEWWQDDDASGWRGY